MAIFARRSGLIKPESYKLSCLWIEAGSILTADRKQDDLIKGGDRSRVAMEKLKLLATKG